VTEDRITIVLPVFPGVTLLDIAGPYEVFSRVPGAKVLLAGHQAGTVEADNSIALGPVQALAEIPACDVICVAGGPGVDAIFQDEFFMMQMHRLASDARYVAAVGTGALLLGALGFLDGRRAASHWVALEFLPRFGAVASREPLVRDGTVFTSAGGGAGGELALALVEEVASQEVAEIIKLSIVGTRDEDDGPEAPPSGALRAFETFMARTKAMRSAAVDQAIAKRAAMVKERAELTAAGLLPPDERRGP
jgi:transcriptional regulator GlxA family with amidase domain